MMEKKPSLNIYDSAGKLISYSHYTITYSSERKSVGTSTYKVTFNGSYYSGTKTVSFVIVPKKSTIKKVSVGNNYMTVYATSKASSLAGAGYQIAYRVLGTTRWKYTTTTLTSKNISKLIKGKKYQVMIRAYKKVGRKNYYGAWSSTKTSEKVR